MKILAKELRPILELFAAVMLGVLAIPLGVLHNIIKPFVDAFKFKRLKPHRAVIYILMYYLNFAYQIWNVIKRLMHDIAVSIDIFGNATSGEAIEDLITPKENTYYGNGKVTISAATGYLVYLYKVKKDYTALNRLGLWFNKALNIAFNEKEHALWSFEREVLQQYTKENKGIK